MTDVFRVAILGSGPAGLSAAAHAAALGLSHVLLEKTDHLSDTIYRYQKGKHVMATPSQLVLRADLEFAAGKREAILEAWNAGAAARGVNVRYGAEVKSVEGEAGDFSIKLTNGEVVRSETLILAIGTQGNPNLMRCEGGHLSQVQYQLDDPGAYMDEHITVVGSGDAGIENALGLIADPALCNVVTILNRSADFARAKDANVKLLTEARDSGRMTVLTEAMHEQQRHAVHPAGAGEALANDPQRRGTGHREQRSLEARRAVAVDGLVDLRGHQRRDGCRHSHVA